MLTDVLPAWAQPSCRNLPALSFFYGGLSHAVGLDNVFVRDAQPLHWALAGGLADYQCKGQMVMDQQLAMNMAAGYGGGMIASVLLG